MEAQAQKRNHTSNNANDGQRRDWVADLLSVDSTVGARDVALLAAMPALDYRRR